MQGSEIAQLYITLPSTPWNHVHPTLQLKGFSKVKDLVPGETRTSSITLDKYAISYWEEGINRWRGEVGDYDIVVGSSSEEARLQGSFRLGKVIEWSGL